MPSIRENTVLPRPPVCVLALRVQRLPLSCVWTVSPAPRKRGVQLEGLCRVMGTFYS